MKTKIQINYKSGQSMVVKVDSMSVGRNKFDGTLSLEWSNMEPQPLTIGVDDIESIWELR